MATGNRSAPSSAAEPDLSTWIPRHEAAAFLGVSEYLINRYTQDGKLHPRRRARSSRMGPAQVFVFDPAELAALKVRRTSRMPSRDPGEIAARAFECFDAGESVRSVVMRLRRTPAEVLELREQWLDAGGADRVISDVAKIELERILGAPFESVADLIELARARAKDDER